MHIYSQVNDENPTKKDPALSDPPFPRSRRRKEKRTGGKKRFGTFFFVDKREKRLYNNYGGIAGDHDCPDGKFYPNQQRRRVCRKVSEI